MATEKNITMKQFNGTDYDTLYPKTIASQIPDVYSKTDTITAETLSRLGLSADKLPIDAFQQIKTLIDNVQSSADSKARIQTGSYMGTGTYGADNPCSLTFDFAPAFLIILGSKSNDGSLGSLTSTEALGSTFGNAVLIASALSTDYIKTEFRQALYSTNGYYHVYSYGAKSDDGKTLFLVQRG